MRKSVLAAFLGCFLVAAVSCSKTDPKTPDEPSPDFLHLRIGNYWVYEFYRIDTNGLETKLEGTDSAFILKDTVINGLTYFARVQEPLQFTKNATLVKDTIFLRDSSGYLVDWMGNILFARDNFTDILAMDTLEGLTRNETRMMGKDSLVNVPAGSFVTRTLCRTWFPLDTNYPWGIRKNYSVYGNDAGLLKYNYWFYFSGNTFEARLVRYSKNGL